MKRSSRPSYKALYQDLLLRQAGKDKLIGLLQQQLTQMAGEREIFLAVGQEQQRQIMRQQDQLAAQQQQLDLQQQTILGQAAKLTQQQQFIVQQDHRLTEQQLELDRNKKELFKLDDLRHQLRLTKKMLYGIKSEKRHFAAEAGDRPAVAQLTLPMPVEAWGVCHITHRRRIRSHTQVFRTTVLRPRGGRHDFPPGLEEQITVIEPPGIPAGARCVGHVDQRQLACLPMRWYVRITRRPVYLAAAVDKLHYKQLIAPLPPHPIAKCKMDVSVLVTLLTDKYLYHLPVWRQQQRFARYGVDLSYSTLCNLVNRTCEVLEPLWHLLLKEHITGGLLHADETTYRVLDDTKKKGKKSHIGWMWALMNPVQRMACFLYQPGRGRKDIHAILHGYKGYLMTDAYSAYSKYGRQPGVVHQQCLSHARRYFIYALENDAVTAGYALDHFFGPLYDIEEECRALQLDYDSITARRQTESLPILRAFRQWLLSQASKTIGRTPIHRAIAYSLNHFDALLIYTSDGMLSIDNNLLEGQIRSIALGRNNHLFAGSHRAGELAAVIYSLLATCKLQKIDPVHWLDDVLRRIPAHPRDRMIELLPQCWKPQVAAVPFTCFP